MPLQLVPFTEREAPAVLAFNQRMAAARAPIDFLLPERAADAAAGPAAALPRTQYLAVDQGVVRGGVALTEQPTWLNGRVVSTFNYQAPLSEGIVDRRYGFVALHMLKHFQRQSPLSFAVGMGGEQNALPRLLKALGWTIRPVPFLFRISKVRRVLAELAVLQRSPARQALARIGSASGTAWLGVRVCQARSIAARWRARGITIVRASAWGAWADELWQPAAFPYSFAVMRDRRTLENLYPIDDGKMRVYVVRRGSSVVGWAACLVSDMHAHKDFGNLRVATVLDCGAAVECAGAVAVAAGDAMAREADLVITNQSHASWVSAFRAAGFLPGPSNYLFATSPALTEGIRAGGGDAGVHVTRGDGDGRIHL